MTYNMTVVKITPESPYLLTKFSINQTKLTVDIGLASSKVGSEGVTAEFNLTGKLLSYSPSHT